ncbi:hypothetical protein LMG9446_2219 [Lactococcus lactis subsp. lactis]|nr:hypothetical protein KF134_0806 [Lactococcus lactis subsp. lactis]KST92974.1 hypothetical protein LKF67_1115 [Lactococcus lactis subsp. lactis]KST94697.1 hypothetical protein KF146_2037 [Lactococcus lactis subsp. lactis]KSU00681.1 hypothetical protein KF196_0047 [Lactococcus lactis subsp. lactis]KSU10670.1 hypothetical protein LMG9446_2219 [Lactococcus lactis subsp. lactis]
MIFSKGSPLATKFAYNMLEQRDEGSRVNSLLSNVFILAEFLRNEKD